MSDNTTLLASLHENKAKQDIQSLRGLILFLILRMGSLSGGSSGPSFRFLQ